MEKKLKLMDELATDAKNDQCINFVCGGLKQSNELKGIMKTISKKKVMFFLLVVSVVGPVMSFAQPALGIEKKVSILNGVKTEKNSYQPYVQFGGTRFFQVKNFNVALTADFFVPLWQRNLTDLVFADVRINDRSGTPIEGNFHLGYRHLFPVSQQIFGIYGSL